MKKADKKIHFYSFIPFTIMWLIILTFISVGYNEGVLSAIKDAFGSVLAVLLIILGLVAITSVIYLPLVIKKESTIQLIMYSLTFAFCVCLLISVNMGENKFRSFSSENWTEYPARRITMYDDLRTRHNLNGLSAEKIEELLGEPDFISDNGTYIYDSTHGNAVYVEFENGKSTDCYYVD